ncbi:hypothetical protein MKW98_002419 [Papaver atlanticum]|uniref:Uncharacterized protein n=1 Tax=Papaver atlanticum TaxID=357466 RepID=A0AAD4SC46_9MAGN|nr:hypothetical protein MKW98_002419 [Papaver atlanticum]
MTRLICGCIKLISKVSCASLRVSRFPGYIWGLHHSERHGSLKGREGQFFRWKPVCSGLISYKRRLTGVMRIQGRNQEVEFVKSEGLLAGGILFSIVPKMYAIFLFTFPLVY